MSGAAFSKPESRGYASVIPSKFSGIDLNLAVIDGAITYSNRYVEGAIDKQLGPQALEIKQMAAGGGPEIMQFKKEYSTYMDELEEPSAPAPAPTQSNTSGGLLGGFKSLLNL
jgi:hypothetical protein